LANFKVKIRADMKTIITIKKKKPAYKALILLAKALEKEDNTSISVSEIKKESVDLILPVNKTADPFIYFDLLTDFPTFDELRQKAWPKVS